MRNFRRWVKGFLLIAAFVLVLGSVSLPSKAATPKLNKTSVTIKVGKTVKLKVKGTKKKVKWSSSKKKVCTVTAKGLVKAKKKGTATIKAKVGKKTLKCKVTVKAASGGSTNPSAPTPAPSVKATGLKINGASSVLAPGGAMQLSVSFLPANARQEAVTWGVSDSYYASVTNGLVKAGTREGTVKIYAWLDADGDGWRDSDEIYASYDIRIKNISVTGATEGAAGDVRSADGGDLLLTDGNAKAIFTFALSDALTGVVVNVQDSTGTVVRSYSLGTVRAGTNVSCTWDLKNSSGAKVSAGSYRFEIQAAGTSFVGNYFIVYAKSEFGVGNGSSASPYRVSTLEQLKLVGSHNGVCFVQTANIDANLTEITPLFTVDVPFTGTYDGGGYSIMNVGNVMASNYIGIFARVGSDGTVQNLTVEDGIFTGASHVAALVGVNSGTISNCTVKNCSVTASGLNGAALVGYNEGTIKNCKTSGNTVINQNDYDSKHVGGVCAYNKGTVTGCVSSLDNLAVGGEMYGYTGGIVGLNAGNVISCQVSSDNISCDTQCGDAGGIAGGNTGTVANNSVNGCEISSYYTPGGIIGYNQGNNTNNTYTGSLNQVGR